MPVVWMCDPVSGKVALFDENGTSGDPIDPMAARNAPLQSPAAHLDKVYFHSDLDYMEVSHGPTVANVSHALVAAVTDPGAAATPSRVIAYGTAVTTHTLLTHSLGYVPYFLVVLGGDIVYPGQPVQVLSDGRQRRVVAYADSTTIKLREWAVQTNATMAAVNLAYTVVVFRAPPAPSGTILYDWDPTTGIVQMGRGKFRSDRRYLQVVPGGSPYGFSLGRTIDLKNGAPRYVDPDGSIFEPIPSDFALKVRMSDEPNDAPYGPPMAYNGSFAGSASVLVQVP